MRLRPFRNLFLVLVLWSATSGPVLGQSVPSPSLPTPSLPPPLPGPLNPLPVNAPERSEPLVPNPDDLPSALPEPLADSTPVEEEQAAGIEALLERLQRLEDEVKDVRALRDRVAELETELESLKGSQEIESDEAGEEIDPEGGRSREFGSKPFGDRSLSELSPKHSSHSWSSRARRRGNGDQNNQDERGDADDDPTAGYSQSTGEGSFSIGGGGGSGPSAGGSSASGGGQGSIGRGERVGERRPLQVDLKGKYKYNFAGGFFQFSDEDGEFVLNVQNIITADGTFHDRENPPTEWQGFNIPFQRLYLYGNITKNWEFQISEQSSLGNINLLDLIINVHYDDRLMIKAGKFLAPFYYQDYATFPMLVPAITYSPLSQFSAQRQPGVMAWGKLFQNRLQYQTGVFTGIPASFFDLDNNVDFISSLSITPFMGSDLDELQNFGFGVSTQVGWQNYMLDAIDVPTVIAGTDTPNLNRQFVTATNVPFFTYNDDVRALGERIRVAPHLFYYGRFSFLSEYVFQSRALASPLARGNSIQHGFYVTGSYFLTGERYTGDGTGGFPTIMPNRPFNPSNNEYGPGAHELAFQYTLLNVGEADIRRGFADPVWATQLSEIMLGYNWWPNKYVRLSVNWIYDELNRPIPWPLFQQDQRNGVRTNPIQEFNVVWFRLAMFF